MKTYHKWLLSAATGFLLYSGWSTWLPFPLMLVALVPLLFVEELISKTVDKRSFYAVFSYAWFGFIFWNMLSIWWGSIATVSALAVPFINGAFLAFIFACYHLVKKRLGVSYGRMFLLVAWLAFEYVHHFWEWQF
ncbi:MAG TPA: hypothetical protein DCQ31_05230, partial [Bacteroidales bacterium]|nr:hypothetical protein [Bacteroidales bacterium]